MQEAFRLVIFNKDLFGEIKKHRQGASYKENPEYVINVFIENEYDVEKWDVYELYGILTNNQKNKIIEKDMEYVYEKIKHNINEDFMEAAEKHSYKILHCLIARYDISIRKCENSERYLIIKILEIIFKKNNIYGNYHGMKDICKCLIKMIPNLYIQDNDGVKYRIYWNGKADRVKINSELCVKIPGYIKDYKDFFI